MTSGPAEDDPEQLAVLESIRRLGRDGPVTAGAVADELCFPPPEVRRMLDKLSPARVAVGPDDGEDGTPRIRLA